MSVNQKRELINPSFAGLSVQKQCQLIDLQRSSYYFKPRGESGYNQMIMKKIDSKFLECPFYGVERMTNHLNQLGIFVNIKRVRRLYQIMALDTLMPKPNTSKNRKVDYKYPYLLRNLTINRSNQVWQADITYLPMFRGFMYKFAIIDVYSRKILGWSISNTMSTPWCVEVVEETIKKYGKPEIFNTDQGVQFTNEKFVNCLKNNNIQISMDGKGRATDNAFIERYWRSYKYEYLYLNPTSRAYDLFEGTNYYVRFYNKERSHSSLGNITPNEMYYNYRNLKNLS